MARRGLHQDTVAEDVERYILDRLEVCLLTRIEKKGPGFREATECFGPGLRVYLLPFVQDVAEGRCEGRVIVSGSWHYTESH